MRIACLSDLDFLSQLGGISVTKNQLTSDNKADYKPPQLVRLASTVADG